MRTTATGCVGAMLKCAGVSCGGAGLPKSVAKSATGVVRTYLQVLDDRQQRPVLQVQVDRNPPECFSKKVPSDERWRACAFLAGLRTAAFIA
jgi:hypothetical protein